MISETQYQQLIEYKEELRLRQGRIEAAFKEIRQEEEKIELIKKKIAELERLLS